MNNPRYRKLLFAVLGTCTGIVLLTFTMILVLDPGRIVSWRKNQGRNVPMIFYGRAVDTNGNGVANATVTFRVDQINPWSLFDGKNYRSLNPKVITDTNGVFTLNTTGLCMVVSSVESENTVFAWLPDQNSDDPVNKGFFYEDRLYRPDVNNPAVFPMILRGGQTTVKGYRGGKTGSR